MIGCHWRSSRDVFRVLMKSDSRPLWVFMDDQFEDAVSASGLSAPIFERHFPITDQ
ncbi:hypothetical protein B0H12DRAFT_1153411 [Mycena haematopus]|nr:hypothetical protein B0H12DRAFT_1153411 [Mycena haematopus]